MERLFNMGTTAQKLNKILETKEAIRTAINNKGGTLTTTDTFASYPSAIDSLPSGGGGSLKTLLDATKSTYYLFFNYSGTSVEGLISYSDTSGVENMRYMFFNCPNLSTIPQLDTSSVTNMEDMFSNCSSLITIPQLDTSKVTSTSNMFYKCQNLTTISQFDTSKVIDMRNMFRYCYNLTTIDITHMNLTSTSNSSYFADDCYSLTKLIIRNMPSIPNINSNTFTDCYHFKGITNATYNPQGLKDGRIYVPDDKVDALKKATNWSAYSDIIVPLSTLVE